MATRIASEFTSSTIEDILVATQARSSIDITKRSALLSIHTSISKSIICNQDDSLPIRAHVTVGGSVSGSGTQAGRRPLPLRPLILGGFPLGADGVELGTDFCSLAQDYLRLPGYMDGATNQLLNPLLVVLERQPQIT
jgi:hypothetical protein